MSRRSTLLAAVILVACGSDEDAADNARDWVTARLAIGDTTVVRTSGGSGASGALALVPELSIGSADTTDEYTIGRIAEMDIAANGDIFVVDAQVPALRVYDRDGRFIRTIGRGGAGPGEYGRVSGLAVHRDGRVMLWDAANARMNVYDARGGLLAVWPFPRSGFSTSRGVFIDTAGFTYARTRIWVDPDPMAPTQLGFLRWAPDGRLTDSLRPPAPPITANRIGVSVQGRVMITVVPFTPVNTWTRSPYGYFVSANTGRYSVLLHRPEGPLRIEREVDPVHVTSDERTNNEEMVIASMRQIDPTWRWSGPPIPDTKPYLMSLTVGRDGRIWARVSQLGERIPDAELDEGAPSASGAQRRPVPQWREPVVYDVFEPSGEFVGRLAVPPRITLFVMDGDRAWGVTRDSLDVEQITRFRIGRRGIR